MWGDHHEREWLRDWEQTYETPWVSGLNGAPDAWSAALPAYAAGVKLAAEVQDLANQMVNSLEERKDFQQLRENSARYYLARAADIARIADQYLLAKEPNAYDWRQMMMEVTPEPTGQDDTRWYQHVLQGAGGDREKATEQLQQAIEKGLSFEQDYEPTHLEKEALIAMRANLRAKGGNYRDALDGTGADLAEYGILPEPRSKSILMRAFERQQFVDKTVKDAMRKQKMSAEPTLYNAMVGALDHWATHAPEAYKMFPWAVKQMKSLFSESVSTARTGMHFGSIEDLVTEYGPLYAQHAAEHRLPKGFDLNKMTWKEFQEYADENLGDPYEDNTRIVAHLKDGWTIRELTGDDEDDFTREGEENSNCIRDYEQYGWLKKVQDGYSHIFSLRDPKNNPKVSIETVGPAGTYDRSTAWPNTLAITQEYGHGNSTPLPKYKERLDEWKQQLEQKGIATTRGHHDVYWDDDDEEEEAEPEYDPELNEYVENSEGNVDIDDLDELRDYREILQNEHHAFEDQEDSDDVVHDEDGPNYGYRYEQGRGLNIGADWEELMEEIIVNAMESDDESDQRQIYDDLESLMAAIAHGGRLGESQALTDALLHELDETAKRTLKSGEQQKAAGFDAFAYSIGGLPWDHEDPGNNRGPGDAERSSYGEFSENGMKVATNAVKYWESLMTRGTEIAGQYFPGQGGGDFHDISGFFAPTRLKHETMHHQPIIQPEEPANLLNHDWQQGDHQFPEDEGQMRWLDQPHDDASSNQTRLMGLWQRGRASHPDMTPEELASLIVQHQMDGHGYHRTIMDKPWLQDLIWAAGRNGERFDTHGVILRGHDNWIRPYEQAVPSWTQEWTPNVPQGQSELRPQLPQQVYDMARQQWSGEMFDPNNRDQHSINYNTNRSVSRMLRQMEEHHATAATYPSAARHYYEHIHPTDISPVGKENALIDHLVAGGMTQSLSRGIADSLNAFGQRVPKGQQFFEPQGYNYDAQDVNQIMTGLNRYHEQHLAPYITPATHQLLNDPGFWDANAIPSTQRLMTDLQTRMGTPNEDLSSVGVAAQAIRDAGNMRQEHQRVPYLQQFQNEWVRIHEQYPNVDPESAWAQTVANTMRDYPGMNLRDDTLEMLKDAIINPVEWYKKWRYPQSGHAQEGGTFPAPMPQQPLPRFVGKVSGYYADKLGPESEEDWWNREPMTWDDNPTHVFRTMSEDHFQQSMRDGVHQSDERGNYLGQMRDDPEGWVGAEDQAVPEGTVAGRWSYPGYLVNSPNGIGRVVKIRVQPEDGWEPHPDDQEGGYFRTFKPIPIDRFESWTDPIDSKTWHPKTSMGKDMSFDAIQEYRVPFYAYPDGNFDMAPAGFEHWEIEGEHQPPEGESSEHYQGHVIFHPTEGEVPIFPLDYKTEGNPAWLTPEYKERLLDSARAYYDSVEGLPPRKKAKTSMAERIHDVQYEPDEDRPAALGRTPALYHPDTDSLYVGVPNSHHDDLRWNAEAQHGLGDDALLRAWQVDKLHANPEYDLPERWSIDPRWSSHEPLMSKLRSTGVPVYAGSRHIAMAERSGDPTLDTLVASYIRNRMLDPMMRDPQWAAGACAMESNGLAKLLHKNGIRAWVQSMAEQSDEHYKSFEEMGYGDRQPGKFDSHAVVIAETETGRYMIDLSGAQYGYKEFPMVQRLDEQGGWQRQWNGEEPSGRPVQGAQVTSDPALSGWRSIDLSIGISRLPARLSPDTDRGEGGTRAGAHPGATARVSNELTCPHCGSSGGLMKTPKGEWMCLDCYWQEGETLEPGPVYPPKSASAIDPVPEWFNAQEADPADDDLFVCDRCGKPHDIEDSVKVDEGYFCPACLDAPLPPQEGHTGDASGWDESW